MLLPIDINPKLSIYYNGAMVLKVLRSSKEGKLSLIDLYGQLKENSVSFPQLILCLDWLYLINVAKIDDYGAVSCI